MTGWLAANLGTILVSLILTGVVSLIVVRMIKKKKRGVSSCGCGCAHCAMNESCHQK